MSYTRELRDRLSAKARAALLAEAQLDAEIEDARRTIERGTNPRWMGQFVPTRFYTKAAVLNEAWLAILEAGPTP